MSSVWEPPALSRVEVDEVWKAVGRYGRFQVVQIFILLVSGLSMAFPVLSGVFEGTLLMVFNPFAALSVVCRTETELAFYLCFSGDLRFRDLVTDCVICPKVTL